MAPVDEDFEALIHRHTAAIEEGRIADAEHASAAIMAAALERAQADPSPEILKGLLADQAEADGQWDVARRIYEEELASAENEEVPLARACLRSRALMHLASLDRWEGNHIAAYHQAKVAVEAAREGDSLFLLALIVEQFAGFALRAGYADKSIAAANEGLICLDESRTNDHVRCLLLCRRAEGYRISGDTDSARRDLNLAWRVIEPLSAMRGAAGIQSSIARYWHIEARLRTDQHDWEQSRIAWENAVQFGKAAAQLWEDANWQQNAHVAQILAEFALAARAASKHQLADTLQAESREIGSRCPATA